MIVPPALPVKVTMHVALLPLPLSAQLALDGETLAPLAVTLNVPVGVTDPDTVSFTVTVQTLDCPTLTTGLTQLTDVELARFTSIEALPELVACVLSPA
mgnify:CR=1 FL=1